MKLQPTTEEHVITHGHLFCGIGVGAKGMNLATPRVANIRGRFKCLGGIDVDAGAIRNFQRMTGVPGTVMDLFDLDQHRAFHGKDPAPGWQEATPADILQAFGGETPDVVFLSAPCKGFSGLLATAQSKTDKYQALNALTLRGVWLTLEAYKNNPIPIILFENVPRIATRGRWLLDQIIALLRSYGYSVNEDTHDCGVIGGLAQSRKRFLLIARHSTKVPPFIYQPTHHRLRGVGEVIGKLPLPGDPIAGSMHRVPSLQWKTWVRLAFVPAGKDWRALNDLAVVDGELRDFGIVPEIPLRDNALGVSAWTDTAPVITTHRAPGQGRFSVADPRVESTFEGAGQYGVQDWQEHSGVVGGRNRPANGSYSVADPRYADRDRDSTLGVQDWEAPTGTIQAKSGPTNGAFSVADPRPGYGPQTHQNILAVAPFDEASKTIGAAAHVAGGALSVADPRPGYGDATHRHVLGVNEWQGSPTGTISGDPKPSTGAYSVADPRVDGHPRSVQLGVRAWDKPAACVKGDVSVGTGPYAVSDPRLGGKPRFNNTFRIVGFDQTSVAVAGPGGPAGGAAVADPRPDSAEGYTSTKYKVTRMDEASRTVIGASTTGDGAFAVADPRPDWNSDRHTNILRVTPDDEPAGTITGNAHSVTGGQACVADSRAKAFPVQDPRAFGGTVDRGHYQGGGHYGVIGWEQTGHAVPGSANHDNGFNSVADPREAELDAAPVLLPRPEERLVCRIISTDNTWHRPFTTLDLAALQSLFDPEEAFGCEDGTWFSRTGFDLDATSDVNKREWIGNAVPGNAARGMAETIGEAIILARIGETFQLSAREIWVKPGALALAVDNDQIAFRMDAQ